MSVFLALKNFHQSNFTCYLVLIEFKAVARLRSDAAGGLILPSYNPFDFHPEI